MKIKLLVTLSLLFITGGILAGIKAAGQSPTRTFTLHQETRDNSGNLIWTDVHVHDNGRSYWKHSDIAKGFSETWIMNEHGGYRNAVDPEHPEQFYREKNGRRIDLPESMQSWEGFIKSQGPFNYVREEQYKGYRVAVFSDGYAERWYAQEFWPVALKTVMVAGTTETIEFSGTADVKVFEVK